jgi:hypothetical protein
MATQEEMDAAAQRAAADLAALREQHPEAVALLTDWWRRYYTTAGHKRLGRVLLGPRAGAREGAGARGADD